MPYRAVQKGDVFQLSEIDASGNQVRYIGAAPDKKALQALVDKTVAGPPKTIEFDDAGRMTKDEIGDMAEPVTAALE
jgi:hypothetical protein